MAKNKGQKIGCDFFSKNNSTVSRLKIRAFIYNHVLNQRISNQNKSAIRFVMDNFNLRDIDFIKVKKMIEIILHRDNKHLPPIIFEEEDNITLTQLVRYGKKRKHPAIECNGDQSSKLIVRYQRVKYQRLS